MRGLFVAILAAMLAFPLTAAVGPDVTFRAPVPLPFSESISGPSLVADAEGYLFVAAPGGPTSAWRSLDDGQTWTRQDDTQGAGGGSDLAVDAAGRIYAADLSFDVAVSASPDHAASWGAPVHVAASNLNDRPWLAASGAGRVWAAYLESGGAERVAASADGGLTWTRSVAAQGVVVAGRPIATSVSDVALPYVSGGLLFVAASRDGGASWTSSAVAPVAGRVEDFPAIAADDEGNWYVAWSDFSIADFAQPRPAVHVAHSVDHGATWSSPQTISSRSKLAMMPAIVAGTDGAVALAWYEGESALVSQLDGDPNHAATARWHVALASTRDGHAARPAWRETAASGVIHRGPVCDARQNCAAFNNGAAYNRELGDLLGLAALPDGRVAIAYTGDVSDPISQTFSQAQLFVVVQDGGTGLR